jgi:hypothetical protein
MQLQAMGKQLMQSVREGGMDRPSEHKKGA